MVGPSGKAGRPRARGWRGRVAEIELQLQLPASHGCRRVVGAALLERSAPCLSAGWSRRGPWAGARGVAARRLGAPGGCVRPGRGRGSAWRQRRRGEAVRGGGAGSPGGVSALRWPGGVCPRARGWRGRVAEGRLQLQGQLELPAPAGCRRAGAAPTGAAGAARGRGQRGRGIGMGGRTAGRALVRARDSRRPMWLMIRWKVCGVQAAASSAAGSWAGR